MTPKWLLTLPLIAGPLWTDPDWIIYITYVHFGYASTHPSFVACFSLFPFFYFTDSSLTGRQMAAGCECWESRKPSTGQLFPNTARLSRFLDFVCAHYGKTHCKRWIDLSLSLRLKPHWQKMSQCAHNLNHSNYEFNSQFQLLAFYSFFGFLSHAISFVIKCISSFGSTTFQ